MFLSGMLLWLIEHGWVMLLQSRAAVRVSKAAVAGGRGAADSPKCGTAANPRA